VRIQEHSTAALGTPCQPVARSAQDSRYGLIDSINLIDVIGASRELPLEISGGSIPAFAVSTVPLTATAGQRWATLPFSGRVCRTTG